MRDVFRPLERVALSAGLSLYLAFAVSGAGAQGSDGQPPPDVFLDKPVWGAESENIGTVTDVIVDRRTEQPVQIIVARRSFLGLGGKEVGLGVGEVTYDPDARIVNAPGLTRDDLAGRQEAVDADGGSTVSLRRARADGGL